ncbi:unnamed protein product [Acanthocheilonema viteae]|uniref:Uncharacterized protein n=1 Tax=Acanthocheilonema viteae TaxID=6277 RepID=A0A498SS86_ACAVI|nr:unnamed protein product [Acanthocheilonema viteae]
MKIQLSLRNEPETPVDRETVSKKEEKKKKELPSTQSDTRAKNIVPCSQDQSMSTSLSIKKKPTFSGLKAQDSLMIVNSEISLQPSQSAEKINEKTGWKENESTPLAMKIHDSDDKSAFVTAKAQDSLMVVNDLKPLQPSTSAEQTIWEKSEESKIARQKEIEL